MQRTWQLVLCACVAMAVTLDGPDDLTLRLLMCVWKGLMAVTNYYFLQLHLMSSSLINNAMVFAIIFFIFFQIQNLTNLLFPSPISLPRPSLLAQDYTVSSCWEQIFHITWLHFIGDLHHVNTIMDFGKISSKAQKSPYLHKNASKPMVQAHSTSSHFSAHDLSSWVSSGEFWESWYGGPRNMFSKAPVVQSW